MKKSNTNFKELEFTKELIDRSFYFLVEKYFYKKKYIKKHNRLFIESVEFEYTNEAYDRRVRISFLKGRVNDEIIYSFGLTINRISFTSVEDYFSLDNYLKSKKSEFSTSFSNKFDLIKSENILNKMSHILQTDLLSLITGELWYNEFYPRKD